MPRNDVESTGLLLQGIGRQFGSVVALAGVDLTVRDGELLTLLGPSGSGKTTLLNIIAGFQYPDQGRILLAGHDITDVPPSARNIGMVFQNYALFPHMTVAENIAFPLQMRKKPRQEVERRVTEALALVALQGFGNRLPGQLSGGQQQRVALARAFVFQPRMLLLDEPLGALDRKLREQIQLEIRQLQQRLGVTAVFVTHDQEEALIISDRIAVMNHGKIVQIGTPEEVYARPASRFVAEFVGESNLFAARPEGPGVALIGGGTRVLHDGAGDGWDSLLVRPERVRPAEGAAFDNVYEARVAETVYLGESIRVRAEHADGFSLLARWQTREVAERPAIGEVLTLGFNRGDVQLLSDA